MSERLDFGSDRRKTLNKIESDREVARGKAEETVEEIRRRQEKEKEK